VALCSSWKIAFQKHPLLIWKMSVIVRPPLWSNGQSFWLQIQRSGFDSRLYHIFQVVGLERGPLSPVSATEELLGRKRSGCGLEIREYGRRDQSRWPHGNLYPHKLALTSPTSGGRSVGIVRSERLWKWRHSRSKQRRIEHYTKPQTLRTFSWCHWDTAQELVLNWRYVTLQRKRHVCL
jgi:hypothetical protein